MSANLITAMILISCVVLAVFYLLIRDRLVKWMTPTEVEKKDPSKQTKFWKLMDKMFFLKSYPLSLSITIIGVLIVIAFQVTNLLRNGIAALVPATIIGFLVAMVVMILLSGLLKFVLWVKERLTKNST